jgi:hypothetical protein
MPNLGDKFATESEANATPLCPHCGGPMERATAMVCAPDGKGGALRLPPHCPSKDCQDARDYAAMKSAIARGVIVCCHSHSGACADAEQICCDLCPIWEGLAVSS